MYPSYRILSILLVALLAFLTVPGSGCGGEEDRLKSYVKSGEERMPSPVETGEMVEQLGRLANLAGTGSEQYQSERSEFMDRRAEFEDKLSSATVEYQKVLESGQAGEKYKELAEVQLESIKVINRWLNDATEFVDHLAEAIKEGGGTLDAEADERLLEEFEASNQLLEEQQDLQNRADKLLKELGFTK